MRKTVVGRLGLILSVVFVVPLVVQANTEALDDSRFYQSRYLSTPLGPETAQADLLKTIVDIHFPDRINTVGGALDYLLNPYGYQLDEAPYVDEQYSLLVLKLPEPHRYLTSMTLLDAAATLGGKSFQPLINPVKRSVHFQLREGFNPFITAEDVALAKQQWLELKAVRPLLSNVSQAILAAQKVQQYGPVKAGENLSRIASQLDLIGLTIDQALVYLFHANTHAFANTNMNHLLVGKILNVPPVNYESLPTPVDASQIVEKHYRLWLQREVTP